MKVWNGFGSEHSMNLVMIGQFQNAGDAEKVTEIFERLTKQVRVDEDAGLLQFGGKSDRFTDDMLHLLSSLNVNSIGPNEVEQFAYDVSIKVQRDQLVLTTEESDVSAFLKVLLDHGARIELFSAHDYPDSRYGRGH